MKKMILILVLVAVACAPAMAAVTISGTKSGTSVTLNYSASGNSVRAFAMNIEAGAGNITAVTCTNSSYYIYPGSISIVSGSIASAGDCVCNPSYPDTKGGEGTTAVTVEMGSLYTGTVKPASSGQLLTLTLSNSASSVIVSRNTGRGGVVMEDPAESAADNLPQTFFGDCLFVGRVYSGSGITALTIGTAHMSRWNTLSKPNCWCCVGQKRGNGVYTPSSTAAKVDALDLAKVKNSSVWNMSIGAAGYNANKCSDMNLSGKVDALDLAKIKSSSNWNQTVGAGSNCP